MRPALGLRLAAAGLILLGFGLRLFRLGAQNLWWDEGLAMWAVRQPLAATTLWTAGDVHPPLFFWTLWPWIRLAGESPFAIRTLTVVWGTLIMALAFALGRRLGGPRAGLLALALVALSRFLIWWSMELRMYTLAGLAVLGAVLATLVFLARERAGTVGGDRPRGDGGPHGDGASRREGGPRRDPDAAAPASGRTARATPARWTALAGYVFAATAALYTVYLTAVALLACNLAVGLAFLRRRPSRAGLGGWILAQGLILLLFLPWAALALPRMKTWSVVDAPAGADFVAGLWATLLATGASVAIASQRLPTLAWWLAALLAPAAWLVLRRRRGMPGVEREAPRPAAAHAAGEPGADLGPGASRLPGAGPLLALFVLLPPLAVWAAAQPRAIFYSPHVEARYFLPFAAPVYVLAGWLLARLASPEAARWRQWVGGALAALALGIMALSLPGHYAERRLRDLYASLSMAIWSQAEPGDLVLLVSGNRYAEFLYDYEQPWDRAGPAADFRYLATDLPAPPPRPPVLPFPDRGSEAVDAHPDWERRLEDLAEQHPRIWLVEADRHLQDPEGAVRAWLDANREQVLSEGYGANALHLYAREDRPPRVTQVDGRWPGMGRLDSIYTMVGMIREPRVFPVFGMPAREILPGDPLDLSLFARSSATGAIELALEPGWRGSMDLGSGPTVRRLRVALPDTTRLPGGTLRPRIGAASTTAQAEIRGRAPIRADSDLDADFGFMRLLRAGASRRSLRPGEPLVVDLTWRPRDDGPSGPRDLHPALAEDQATVFVHLVGPPRPDSGDPMWGGHDGPPSGGAWSAYRDPGSTVFDRHILTLDPAAPPGTYTLEAGLYDPATGERYPVAGASADPAARRVILGTVELR